MKWRGIGTKWYNLSFAVNLKVEMLAREIIVILVVLVLQAISVLVPSTTFRLIAFRS